MPGIAIPQPSGLSRSATAIALGLSERTIDRLIRTGEIRAVRIGRRVLIPAAEVDRLLGTGATR